MPAPTIRCRTARASRESATDILLTHPTPAGLRWYDPASFIVSPQGTFGNVGRQHADHAASSVY